MDRRPTSDVIVLLLQGMVEKDRSLLERAIAKDASLFHLSGRRESRETYIQEILDGTLNYSDYEILASDGEETTLRLLAQVYGGPTSWWTLTMSVTYETEDGFLKIKESKVRILS